MEISSRSRSRNVLPPSRPGPGLRRLRVVVRAVLPLAAFLALAAGCKSRTVVWQAERKAQIGGEFIRVFDDGRGEYGYGVVSEKLKAEGACRLAGDTLWFQDPSFKAHFPKGFLPIKHGVVIMESGFHFLVVPPPPAS